MSGRNSLQDSFIYCSGGIVILVVSSVIPAGGLMVTKCAPHCTTITM